MPSRPTKKILALHGYAMNRDGLRAWLAPLEAALQDRAEFVYPQAAIEVPAAEVRAMLDRYQMSLPETKIGAGQNWCWYRATDEKPPRYSGLAESLDQLQRFCDSRGPFDGVLGWSQGAAMAAMLAAAQQNGGGYDFGLRWLVLCGGFMPGAALVKPWFETPLAFPSLHVVGKKESEFMRRRAVQLRHAFVDSAWLETPLGHRMPVNLPQYMQRIAAWMALQLKE